MSAPAPRLGAAVLSLLLAMIAHRSAVALRHDPAHPLAPDIPALAASPGEVAGGLLLGGFRGLFADLVWFRGQVALSGDREDLYNLPALYEKLALLQPQYPEMWAATGHDLAYNAAAKFNTPEGQWTWIRLGVDWLRRGSERIGADPRSSHPRGHRVWEALGWAYLEKCTPSNEYLNGQVWRPLARERWGADPFELSAAAFRTASGFPQILAGRVTMDAHVLKRWAIHTDDPVEELDHLRRSAEAFERHDVERGLGRPLAEILAGDPGRSAVIESVLREVLPPGAVEGIWRRGGDTASILLLRRSEEALREAFTSRGRPEEADRLLALAGYHFDFIRRHQLLLLGLARAVEFRLRLRQEPDPAARESLRAGAVACIREEALRDPDFSDDLPFELRKIGAPPEAYREVARAFEEEATASEARGDPGRAIVCRERAALFLSWAAYLEQSGDGAGN